MQPRLSALILLVLASPTTAQLSGNYTIDPALGGARNYRSFSAAVQDLFKLGASGSVTFVVRNWTYDENINLFPVSGLPASSRITFKAKTRYGVTVSPNSGPALDMGLSTVANPIRGFVFDGIELLGGVDIRSPIRDITFKNNRIHGGLIMGSLAQASGLEIAYCEFFTDTRQSSSSILLRGCENCDIHHCWLAVSAGSSRQSTVVQIVSTTPGTTAKPIRIYNNLIYGRFRYGVATGSTSYRVELAHNTIYNLEDNPAVLIDGGHFAAPHLVFSNIFSVSGASKTALVFAGSTKNFVMDGNLYDTRKPQVPIASTLGQKFSLPTWRFSTGHGVHSFATDPMFLGGSTGADFHVKPGSQAVGKAFGTPAYVTDDYEGTLRRHRIDIGALQTDLPFTKFGVGCFGTAGFIPALGTKGTTRIGSTDFEVTLSKAVGGRGATAWLIVGVSRESWGSIRLPIYFGGQCFLLVSGEIRLRLTVSGGNHPGQGTAKVPIKIPNDLSLTGLQTFFQWAVHDVGAGYSNLAFSNAGILNL